MRNGIVAVAVVFFMLGFAGFVNAAEMIYEQKMALIVQIEDGDTFYLEFVDDLKETKTWYRANLMGVDAAGWDEDGGDCFAEEARQFLSKMILGKLVTISWDSGTKIDEKEERLLVYVQVGTDHLDVGSVVLFDGYGWVPPNYPADRKNGYLMLERMARETGRGLWGKCPASYLKFRPPLEFLPEHQP